MNRKTEMTSEELAALKKKLLADTRKRLDAVWNSPGFQEGHEKWLKEHEARAAEWRAHEAMAQARRRAGITQEVLARRMHVPRANISRMENGQNVTFATFGKYIAGCGCDYRITVFPVKSPDEELVEA